MRARRRNQLSKKQTVLSIEATNGIMPVATATTEPTIEGTNCTMLVATATTKPTTEAITALCKWRLQQWKQQEKQLVVLIFVKLFTWKLKNWELILIAFPNNISCNELPMCSTPKSNQFAVESNSLNCNHNNTYLKKSMFQMFLKTMYWIIC